LKNKGNFCCQKIGKGRGEGRERDRGRKVFCLSTFSISEIMWHR